MSDFKIIYSKLKSKYEYITKESYDKFYETTIAALELAGNNNSSKNILLVKTIRPTKKRWIKIIEKNPNSKFNKDFESVKIQYQKVQSGEKAISEFESFFGTCDIDKYKKVLLKPLHKWVEDDNLFLIDFYYLDEMSNKSVLTAIKNDLYLYYYLYSENQNFNMTKIPEIWSNVPVDITGNVDYLSEAQKKDLDNIDNVSTFEKLILLESDEKENVLMRLEKKTYLEIKNGGNPDKFLDMMTQIALLKSIKYLNSFDTKVINYYYNHFENALTGSSIDKTLYQILKELGLPNNMYYYESLENSLAKIGSINMTYVIAENKIYGSILECNIYEENGVKKAKVYLGGILKELILKDGAFEYDKDVYNSISSMSQQLAVWLQKRRYRLAINKDGHNDSVSVKSFSNAIYFNTKRADRIRKKIIESLEELKSTNLIIKSFNFNKKLDVIVIEYIDLTAKERNKLGILDEDILIEPICIDPNDAFTIL